jgi:dihydrolipoamide dehydrogenase
VCLVYEVTKYRTFVVIEVAEHLAEHKPEQIDYNNVSGCTYYSPEIASVGYTEKAAKDAGYEIKVGKFPFIASGKASASGATEGFVKVIYDAKYGEFLGCHMIGNNVTEMIAEAVTARKLETTGHEILNAIHPHPTMSEALKEATAVAYGEATDPIRVSLRLNSSPFKLLHPNFTRHFISVQPLLHHTFDH